MSNPFRVPRIPGPVAKRAMGDLWDRVTEQLAGTSTTSLTVSIGPKTLDVGADKQFAIGQTVRLADSTDPVGTWMQATVTGYDVVTGALDVAVTDASGFGTHADWSVALSGGTGPKGDDGDPGEDGREVQLQVSATHIQWRYDDAPGWTDLVTLEALRGPAGHEVQLQVSATHIQWRIEGGAVWLNLVPLADLKGLPGDPGAAGWAPVLATVADGARYVHRVVDWVGGGGSKPASGAYVGAAGLVPNIADGVDIRGAAGAGSGDLNGPAGATDGHMVLFDGPTGKLVKSGGAPPAAQVSADWAASSGVAQILNKPTIPAAQQQTNWAATSGVTAIANKPEVIAEGATKAAARGSIDAGDVESQGAFSAGDMAVFSDATGKKVNSGGKPLSLGTTSTTAKPGDYVPPIAAQAAAEVGTNNTDYMTPLRTAQAIAVLAGGGKMTPEPRTANTSLTAADKGKIIEASGSWTQTFAANAALGAGWHVYYRSGGDITFDPSGAETIDGLASYISYPGEVRLIYSDGSALRSFVIAAFRREFLSTENFVKPPGYLGFNVRMNAGGGSGRAILATVGSTASGHGGGGGAGYEAWVPESKIADIELVTVGLGGASVLAEVVTANTNAQANGNPGGNTVFAGMTVFGGTGGTSASGKGGAAIDPVLFPSPPTSATRTEYGGGDGGGSTSVGSTGYYGGGGGGSTSNAGTFNGGPSDLAGRGGNSVRSTSSSADIAAESGQFPSGGGGGAAVANATLNVGAKARSGAGANGLVVIWG